MIDCILAIYFTEFFCEFIHIAIPTNPSLRCEKFNERPALRRESSSMDERKEPLLIISPCYENGSNNEPSYAHYGQAIK
jgi:hypothetical protein